MVSASEFVITTEPTPEQVQYLEDRIYEFNSSATGITDGECLAIFVKEGQGRIVAGICGNTWGSCFEIRQFWVEEARRKQGLGTRLLGAAENEARRRGCRQVLLMTFTFQAPAFYASTALRSSRWWMTIRAATKTCCCASALANPANPAVDRISGSSSVAAAGHSKRAVPGSSSQLRAESSLDAVARAQGTTNAPR
jgi:GNAT superfamily N-acetyltransferase